MNIEHLFIIFLNGGNVLNLNRFNGDGELVKGEKLKLSTNTTLYYSKDSIDLKCSHLKKMIECGKLN